MTTEWTSCEKVHAQLRNLTSLILRRHIYQLDEEEKATPRFVTGVEALSPGLGGCLKHWGQPLISHGCQIGIAGRTQLIEWAAATFS